MCNWSPIHKGERNEAEKIFKEMMAENFPKLIKDIKSQTQEFPPTPKGDVRKITKPRQIINSNTKKTLEQKTDSFPSKK